jgi:hypothetical protein
LADDQSIFQDHEMKKLRLLLRLIAKHAKDPEVKQIAKGFTQSLDQADKEAKPPKKSLKPHALGHGVIALGITGEIMRGLI